MKRNASLVPLSIDHHHGLILAALIKKDAPKYEKLPQSLDGKVDYTLKAWENELIIHFKNEEDILFPAVKGKSNELDSTIEELLEEHVKIEGLVNSLKTGSDKKAILDELGNILEGHIRKEERILFEEIQKLFPEEELAKLIGAIEPVKELSSKK